jgi:hypothetical protein
MTYLFLGRIDSRGGDNWLMQILEIEQSINCCCKIHRSFQDRFLEVDQGIDCHRWILWSSQDRVFLARLLFPAGSVHDIGLQTRKEQLSQSISVQKTNSKGII